MFFMFTNMLSKMTTKSAHIRNIELLPNGQQKNITPCFQRAKLDMTDI